MKTFETVDEIVEHYFSSSSPFKSKIYAALGSLFVIFAIIGIWIPGWPTVSWAVPAAFLFSLSSEKLFRWTLTNEYFGPALFRYYATGKTLPYHVKLIIAVFIFCMSSAFQSKATSLDTASLDTTFLEQQQQKYRIAVETENKGAVSVCF